MKDAPSHKAAVRRTRLGLLCCALALSPSCSDPPPSPSAGIDLPGPFSLRSEVEGWGMHVGAIELVPRVEQLMWTEEQLVLRSVEQHWYLVELRRHVRQRLSDELNAERWIYGPMSQTGYFALSGHHDLPARPSMVGVEEARRCASEFAPRCPRPSAP